MSNRHRHQVPSADDSHSPVTRFSSKPPQHHTHVQHSCLGSELAGVERPNRAEETKDAVLRPTANMHERRSLTGASGVSHVREELRRRPVRGSARKRLDVTVTPKGGPGLRAGLDVSEPPTGRGRWRGYT